MEIILDQPAGNILIVLQPWKGSMCDLEGEQGYRCNIEATGYGNSISTVRVVERSSHRYSIWCILKRELRQDFHGIWIRWYSNTGPQGGNWESQIKYKEQEDQQIHHCSSVRHT